MDPFSVVAPTSSSDGYGYSAESLILAAVREHGADIQFIEHDWRDPTWTDPALFELQAHEYAIPQREVCVTYFLPFALTRFRSQFTIGMSMWETDKLPRAWAASGRLADAWIVPSEHAGRVFAEAIPRPVEVVPFGVDTDLFSYKEREDRPHFVFLMAGLLHYRKGVDFALQAFCEEFSHGEDVQLWLKTGRNFLDPVEHRHLMADDRVIVIDENLPRGGMVRLYHSADAFLAPSRGEGSGLTPREAMATGLPVILTDWSGLAELANERYAYPIPVEALEPAPIECTSYAHGVTGGGPIGNFARPSIPALRAAMRSVYEDRTEGRRRGRAAAEWMRAEWTWGHCAGRWLQAIEKLTTKYVVEA